MIIIIMEISRETYSVKLQFHEGQFFYLCLIHFILFKGISLICNILQ